MDDPEIITLPLTALRLLCAGAWMEGVNAGIREGHSAHQQTDERMAYYADLARETAQDWAQRTPHVP